MPQHHLRLCWSQLQMKVAHIIWGYSQSFWLLPHMVKNRKLLVLMPFKLYDKILKLEISKPIFLFCVGCSLENSHEKRITFRLLYVKMWLVYFKIYPYRHSVAVTLFPKRYLILWWFLTILLIGKIATNKIGLIAVFSNWRFDPYPDLLYIKKFDFDIQHK